MHVETRYFLIFQNILGSTKNFRNQMDFFSSSAKYYFLQKVGTFIETLILTWSSLASNIFSKKSFCFLINLKFKKVVTSLLAAFALSKNKISEASRLIVGPSPFSFQCYLSLSVWCILFIYTISINIICVSQEELDCICVKQITTSFWY